MSKGNGFQKTIKIAIYERDWHLCHICGRNTPFDVGVLDYIIPLRKGGSDDPTNLQWTCQRCNLLKGDCYLNETVRKILGLPTEYNELLSLQQKERRVIRVPQHKYEKELFQLSLEGLHSSEIKEYIKMLHETYQKETIIPELFHTIVHENASEEFVNIGFDFRLPREWFLKDLSTAFFNDPLFIDYGRKIVIAEQEVLAEQIFSQKLIMHKTKGDPPKNLTLAIEKMRDNGIEPNIFWPTIICWSSIHKMIETNVQHTDETSKCKLASTLKIGETDLKIIPPLGKIPRNTLLLGSDGIKWHVKRNPEYGALYIYLGNDRLYPMKYVECIAGTTVRCEINPKRILALA